MKTGTLLAWQRWCTCAGLVCFLRWVRCRSGMTVFWQAGVPWSRSNNAECQVGCAPPETFPPFYSLAECLRFPSSWSALTKPIKNSPVSLPARGKRWLIFVKEIFATFIVFRRFSTTHARYLSKQSTHWNCWLPAVNVNIVQHVEVFLPVYVWGRLCSLRKTIGILSAHSAIRTHTNNSVSTWYHHHHHRS